MLQENETRLRTLVCDEALAQQILDLIHEDEAARHAELIRKQSEGLKRARDSGVRLGRPPAKKPPEIPKRLCHVPERGGQHPRRLANAERLPRRLQALEHGGGGKGEVGKREALQLRPQECPG